MPHGQNEWIQRIAVVEASDGAMIYPESWAHRGPANVNDPGYGYDATGRMTFEIIGNSAVPANCTKFYRKDYTWSAGKMVNESGWVKL